MDSVSLFEKIKQWANEEGFQQVGISNIDLAEHKDHFLKWIENKFHGEMDFMAKHGEKRWRPELLVPETKSILTFRMDYLPEPQISIRNTLKNKNAAYISRYALGRDYHKKIRKSLSRIASRINDELGNDSSFRVFTDSAPILERAFAEKANLGWIGKNTCLINKKAGSWFFLGEILTNIPFEPTEPAASNHCGRCNACIDVCPTKAIVAPNQLDARKCISYLTIEYKGSIPEQYRKAIGNRIYGCDDCQLICPWNKFARITKDVDYKARNSLDQISLIDAINWNENEFNKKLEGSAIRRIGYYQWIRNLAIALGNAPKTAKNVEPLFDKLKHKDIQNSEILVEHIQWALKQQMN